jgi:tetrathionate reductase subunit B
MGTERPVNSRRDFIKAATALGGGLLASVVLKPFGGVVFAANPPDDPNAVWYGIGIDIAKCIGCGRCANACKLENNVPQEPFYFRTWIEHYTILNDHSVQVESPNGGIDGFKQTVPEEDIFKTFFVPKMCNHCYKSPCVQVCPVGATYESPDGVVLVDRTYCIGCRYCVQACPYGCRYILPDQGVVDKCSLCYHRITKGLNPACVEVCPTGARIYGNLREKDGIMAKFLKEHNCQVLKPHLNTGSKLYYNELNAEVR